jgi:hypothetical protein
LGDVGQKFPNDEKNFRIFHGIRSQEGVCYPENEDAIYKQKYAYFTHRYITEACSAVGSSFCLGGGGENEGLWGSFYTILMVKKQCFSLSKSTICLQFSSTKWAKAYLINLTIY